MAQRGGGRSEWERQQAALRREAEREQRERARAERQQAQLVKQQERQAHERRLQELQRSAEQKTAAVVARVAELDAVLTSALDQPPFTAERLLVTPRIPAFAPGALATPGRAPDWASYAPLGPGRVGRLFGGSARHEREVAAARTRWKADTAQFERAEEQRRRALMAAETAHAERVAQAQARAAEHNARIAARRAAMTEGDPEAVEWFVDELLDPSRLPTGFSSKRWVRYRPENRDLLVELDLPGQDIVPAVREYRFVKAREEIKPVPCPDSDVKRRYALLVARTTLRVLHEIFAATPPDVVTAVSLNGVVDSVDRATGQDIRPNLVSVETERHEFEALNLARVEPRACLTRLDARVSNNPFDLEAVEPFIDFDLKRFRFTDSLEELSDLDSRPNLMKLSPTEFEQLVEKLFRAMGASAWRTVPSKDGGVDAVAVHDDMVFGGVCLIQAKRWTKVVGLESVHALTGVMADHNAMRGFLVTTSWFGRASEQFAQRNRISLVNGAELKYLIKKHLGLDVIPGTNPPRRLRATDNTQTGRPGPR